MMFYFENIILCIERWDLIPNVLSASLHRDGVGGLVLGVD
jgi:hypothetical protein